MDANLRDLERRARLGDLNAQAQLLAARVRAVQASPRELYDLSWAAAVRTHWIPQADSTQQKSEFYAARDELLDAAERLGHSRKVVLAFLGTAVLRVACPVCRGTGISDHVSYIAGEEQLTQCLTCEPSKLQLAWRRRERELCRDGYNYERLGPYPTARSGKVGDSTARPMVGQRWRLFIAGTYYEGECVSPSGGQGGKRTLKIDGTGQRLRFAARPAHGVCLNPLTWLATASGARWSGNQRSV